MVEGIAKKQQREVASIIGDSSFLRSIKPEDYISDAVGLPTVKDILAELDKPGRDPRPEFKVAALQEGVEKMSDLKPDMVLEGTVTNVTNFGAFVDIGVHQDGLVHISVLADRFVKDPRDVVKAGDIVKVKVMEVDQERKRIALSMRLADKAEEATNARRENRQGKPRNTGQNREARSKQQEKPVANNAFAAAFSNAKKGR